MVSQSSTSAGIVLCGETVPKGLDSNNNLRYSQIQIDTLILYPITVFHFYLILFSLFKDTEDF